MTVKAVGLAHASRRAACAEHNVRKLTRVALVGPDGVGKSTVIALVREWFEREFPEHQFHVRQWRPCLLPDLGRFLGKPAVTKSVAPRRKPGRLHWLRIFYYYWDFLLGSWWKDRLATTPGALIIYDRCALDMQVDPVRFALRSTRGTRFLCRFTPQPDLVILLEDDPERIWQRKREIQRHEMREQLDCWRELAEAGQVHAIVRVNAGPEEIAARVRQLVLDAMVEDTPRVKTSECSTSNPMESVECLLAGASGALKEFAVLPNRSSPRFLVPLTPRGAAAKSLEIYNPQTWMGRSWRQYATLALRTGITQPLCKDAAALPIQDFQRSLARAAGCSEAVVSISLGTPGVHRKPVFQVMDASGRIRAYAKAGWNNTTNELVQREASALATLGKHAFSTATIPSVLDARWHGENYVLAMAASDGAAEPSPARLDSRHLQFLTELHAIPGQRRGVENRIEAIGEVRQLGFHYYAHILEQAGAVHTAGLPTGFGHGDFSPWNIRIAGGKLLVLDWEYGGEASPAGWDLFHFLIGAGIELQKQSGAQVYRSLSGNPDIGRYFDAVGLSREWVRISLITYLTETLSGNLIRYGTQPSAIDKKARRAWATMLALSLREGTAL